MENLIDQEWLQSVFEPLKETVKTWDLERELPIFLLRTSSFHGSLSENYNTAYDVLTSDEIMIANITIFAAVQCLFLLMSDMWERRHLPSTRSLKFFAFVLHLLAIVCIGYAKFNNFTSLQSSRILEPIQEFDAVYASLCTILTLIWSGYLISSTCYAILTYPMSTVRDMCIRASALLHVILVMTTQQGHTFVQYLALNEMWSLALGSIVKSSSTSSFSMIVNIHIVLFSMGYLFALANNAYLQFTLAQEHGFAWKGETWIGYFIQVLSFGLTAKAGMDSMRAWMVLI